MQRTDTRRWYRVGGGMQGRLSALALALVVVSCGDDVSVSRHQAAVTVEIDPTLARDIVFVLDGATWSWESDDAFVEDEVLLRGPRSGAVIIEPDDLRRALENGGQQ